MESQGADGRARQIDLRVMAPQHLAADRIKRRDLVQRGEHVEHTVDHERRRLQPAETRFVTGAEQRFEIEIGIDGPPAPGDFVEPASAA